MWIYRSVCTCIYRPIHLRVLKLSGTERCNKDTTDRYHLHQCALWNASNLDSNQIGLHRLMLSTTHFDLLSCVRRWKKKSSTSWTCFVSWQFHAVPLCLFRCASATGALSIHLPRCTDWRTPSIVRCHCHVALEFMQRCRSRCVWKRFPCASHKRTSVFRSI
jgi:hypothetical protein